MDISMDIAAMSMNLATSQLQRNLGLAVVKKAMETSELAAQELYQMIEKADQALPSEHLISVKA